MLILDKFLNFLFLGKNNFFYFWRDYFAFLFVKIYLISAIILNGAIWYGADWLIKKLPANLIALHYNIDFGVNLIGEAKNIYILPVLGTIILLVNVLLSAWLVKREEGVFIAHLLLAVGVIVHFYLFVGIYSVYLINFVK